MRSLINFSVTYTKTGYVKLKLYTEEIDNESKLNVEIDDTGTGLHPNVLQ